MCTNKRVCVRVCVISAGVCGGAVLCLCPLHVAFCQVLPMPLWFYLLYDFLVNFIFFMCNSHQPQHANKGKCVWKNGRNLFISLLSPPSLWWMSLHRGPPRRHQPSPRSAQDLCARRTLAGRNPSERIPLPAWISALKFDADSYETVAIVGCVPDSPTSPRPVPRLPRRSQSVPSESCCHLFHLLFPHGPVGSWAPPPPDRLHAP